MKKIFTHAAKRILPLLVFICAQAKAWAVDVTTTTAINKSTNIFTQPWIWIAIIVVSVMVLIGPFDHKEEYRVIMKKKTTDKKRIAPMK
jgi:hypothetical protein